MGIINNNGGGGGSGTVTSVASGDTSLVVTNPTTTPSLQLAKLNVIATNEAPVASVPFNSQKITGLLDPTTAQDAATKNYVDTQFSAVNPAVAVTIATTAAADTSGLTYTNGVAGIGAKLTGSVNTAITIDGVTLTSLTQRVLVKNDTQSPSGAFNGIYNLTQLQTGILPPILTRALDYDQPSDINTTGAIPVISGTANAGSSWICTSTVNTVGTDPVTFTRFSYAATASANAVLTTTGDTLYASAANTLARLALGTQNYPLVAGATIPAYAQLAAAGMAPPTGGVGSGGAVDQFNRQRVREAAIGYGGQTADSTAIPWGTQFTPSTQVIYGTIIGLVAGDVVTNILTALATAAAGTAPTGVFFAIYTLAGVRVAVSNNLNNATNFSSNTTITSNALSSPFTVTTTGGYYICYLANGVWGTTNLRFNTAVNAQGVYRSAAISGGNALCVTQTGQATMPTPATFVLDTAATNIWFAWN